MSTPPTATSTIDTAAPIAGLEPIIEDIAALIVEVIGDDVLLGIEIEPATSFSKDLEMESIEFVALAEKLQLRYGSRVDFTAFLAGLGIDEILALTVGQLAAHIAAVSV